VLGACVLGAAFIASPRFGQQAFAQVTGDRHIVSASVFTCNIYEKWGYLIWSDNVIEMKCLSMAQISFSGENAYIRVWNIAPYTPFANWTQVDNGLTSFVPADVDASGTVDPADLGGVLIEMGNTQEGNPPPPIDCTINAPR